MTDAKIPHPRHYIDPTRENNAFVLQVTQGLPRAKTFLPLFPFLFLPSPRHSPSVPIEGRPAPPRRTHPGNRRRGASRLCWWRWRALRLLLVAERERSREHCETRHVMMIIITITTIVMMTMIRVMCVSVCVFTVSAESKLFCSVSSSG